MAKHRPATRQPLRLSELGNSTQTSDAVNRLREPWTKTDSMVSTSSVKRGEPQDTGVLLRPRGWPGLTFKVFCNLLFACVATFSLIFSFARHDSFTKPPNVPNQGSYAIEFLRRASYNSSSRIHTLLSHRNWWGRTEEIRYEKSKIFNPSMLCLPQVSDLDATYVSVARAELMFAYPDNETEVQPRNLVASLIYDDGPEMRGYDRSRFFPRRAPSSIGFHEDRMEDLVHSPAYWFPKCDTPFYSKWPWYMNNQGPEDGRLLWSQLGEPLMIYHSVSPVESDLCRGMYMIDLRSAYPTLQSLLEKTEDNPPIRFPHSVPLMYPGQHGMSKNWAAFTNAIGEVFIHTNLVPQRIYKLRITGPDDLPHYNSPASQLPIMSALPHDPIADARNCLATTLNLSNVHKVDLHQSSPMLELILCTSDQIDSGVCDPSNPRNRVFIMLIQLVHRGDGTYNDLSYEPRIVTLNSTAPYNYLSVSKPFVYVGVSNEPFVYTMSIAFRPKQRPRLARELAVGHLDDLLIITFGMWDYEGHFIEVEVEDVLQGHQLCESNLI